jgi:hypothetical protein
MAGSGIRSEIASCLQSKTQELQCQHSSGYLISGISFFSATRKTSVGQISTHTPQALHFSFAIIGGISIFSSGPISKHSFCSISASFFRFYPEWGELILTLSHLFVRFILPRARSTSLSLNIIERCENDSIIHCLISVPGEGFS